MNEYLPMISAATALVAVVVGPWVAYKVAKMQIRANVVSANRQAWINALRDDIAELTFTLWHIMNHSEDADLDESKTQISQTHQLMLYYQRICLRINPEEALHLELTELIHATVMQKDKGDFAKCIIKILNKSQEVLKAEWERVKRGD